LLNCSAITILAAVATAVAQDQATPPATTPAPSTTPPPGATPGEEGGLPQINVQAPRQPRRGAQRTAPTRPTTPRPAAPAAPPPPQLPPQQAQTAANSQVIQGTQNLDTQRDTVILPKTGTNVSTLTPQDLSNLPQGANIQISDLVLQFPGVTQ